MSQRSARSAAASATAEVSEPPRPSVVTRWSSAMPWKPATTGICRSPDGPSPRRRRTRSDPSMSRMRALPWAVSVRIGTCQPCQERASSPSCCSAIAIRPVVTCSPVATTASYSRASCIGESAWHQATSWLVTPAMAETTTATSCPASASRLTRRAALRMRSRSATEVPPNFMTMRAMRRLIQAGAAARQPCDAAGDGAAANAYVHGRRRGAPIGDPGETQMEAGRQPSAVAAEVARFGEAGGQRVLDVGCGAGLAAEVLAKTGFSVLGIDAAADLVAAAAAHAAGQRLDLAYRVAAPEDLLAEAGRFDVITALEVIEHVADPADFLRTLRRLARPGAVLVLSTLDRSIASLLTAKIGAEYVLRWLPRGTHDWRKFIRPPELTAALRSAGWRPSRLEGMTYDPLSASWRTVPKPGVNYIVAADG